MHWLDCAIDRTASLKFNEMAQKNTVVLDTIISLLWFLVDPRDTLVDDIEL